MFPAVLVLKMNVNEVDFTATDALRLKVQDPAHSSQPRPRSESPSTPAASEPSSPAADFGGQEGQASETEEWYRTYLKQGEQGPNKGLGLTSRRRLRR